MRMFWRGLPRIGVGILGLALASCATPHSTYAPDGRRGYSITCGGYLSSWSACLIKAGRACGPHGYDVIEGSEYDRSMLIACKAP